MIMYQLRYLKNSKYLCNMPFLRLNDFINHRYTPYHRHYFYLSTYTSKCGGDLVLTISDFRNSADWSLYFGHNFAKNSFSYNFSPFKWTAVFWDVRVNFSPFEWTAVFWDLWVNTFQLQFQLFWMNSSYVTRSGNSMTFLAPLIGQ